MYTSYLWNLEYYLSFMSSIYFSKKLRAGVIKKKWIETKIFKFMFLKLYSIKKYEIIIANILYIQFTIYF